MCIRDRYNFGVLRDRSTGRVISLAPVYDHNLALSTALMDYKHIMASEPDALLQDWKALADNQLQPIKLPPINKQALTLLLEDVNVQMCIRDRPYFTSLELARRNPPDNQSYNQYKPYLP